MRRGWKLCGIQKRNQGPYERREIGGNDKRISRNTVDLVASPVELKGLDSLTR